MDAQTQQGLIVVAAALALALVRQPRARRLLSVLKGALLGALVGAVVFGAPQSFLALTTPHASDDLQWWLLKVAVTCGAFYGLTGGTMVVGLIFAVAEVRVRWQRVRALVRPETADGAADGGGVRRADQPGGGDEAGKSGHRRDD